MNVRPTTVTTPATVLLLCVLFLDVACTQAPTPRFGTELAWQATGQWLRADTHVHTRASDGAHETGVLVPKAKEQGCDVVAITDHADRQLRGGTPEYHAAIAAARAANPGIVVVAGLEWNIPPSGGNEHASLLVPDHPDAGTMLGEFKRQFDDYDRTDGTKPTVESALAWLVDASRNLPDKPVVVYNHPSRRDNDSLANVTDMVEWRKVNDLVVGFEGAPGHQGKPPIGSYTGKETPIDRWDPVVARPGGAWDRLLQQGYEVHGALATSDFHTESPNDLGDYWPCQFAETWLYAPEKSVAGVLRALRAGSFFGVHGRIVSRLDLTVLADGLPRPAMVGEVIQVPVGSEAVLALTMEIPTTDWQGQSNRIDAAEMIVVTSTGAESRVKAVTGTGTQIVGDRIIIGKEGAVVRARVRRQMPDGSSLMAYTNAVRIRAY